MSDNEEEQTPDTPTPKSERSAFRFLSAEEYMRETGRGLIAFPLGNIAFSGPRKPFTPDPTRQEHVYYRLLGFAQHGECTPILPPTPAPPKARERRLAKHWDAMWEWAVRNDATGLMKWFPDDHTPLSAYRREWVQRMEREIPRWSERITAADADIRVGRLTDEERMRLAREQDGDEDWTHESSVNTIAWWRSYGDLHW
jgi:hypothetical protein